MPETPNRLDHSDDAEFYTGYLETAPEGIGRLMKRTVLILFLTVLASAALMAALQKPFDPSFFDFGNVQTFEGLLTVDPYPLLSPARGTDGESIPYYLVAFGKHGATPEAEPLSGQWVSLEGTLIERQGQRMIEVVAGTITATGRGGGAAPGARSLGTQTLQGEIVDSKCHYGVMKPGSRKTHKACAILCIRGGIPPVFVLRNEAGEPIEHLMLVGPEGQEIHQEVLPYVAEPLEITGEVFLKDGLRVLRADPATFTRLL